MMKLWQISFLLIFFNNLSASLLTKVFYHRGQCEDKLVFYFDQDPKISRQANVQQVIYTLKNITLDPAVHQVLAALPNQNSNYQIDFSFKQQNLIVKINFDQKNVTKIAAAKFKPISQPFGIAIKILHQANLSIKSCARSVAPKELVLDFGHGGSDLGAQFGKIAEKDVVRAVGLKLTKILESCGYNVHLTRANDEFVPLDQRTYFANLHTQAGVFISLHANHAPNSKITGLETYYMHYDLFSSIDDVVKTNRVLINTQSASLAKLVHANLLKVGLKDQLVDRKVKQSVSQVLLGVEMPAILIELGFLSNPKEARLLDSPKYQDKLAQGIAQGLKAYFATL